MRFNKTLEVVILISLILPSFFLIEPLTADEGFESRVDAVIDIEFVTATDFKISITMDVNLITIYGTTTYDNSEIQTLGASTTQDAIEDMGTIKGKLRQLIMEQIESSFENADVVAMNKKPTYENSRFFDEVSVNLTSQYFDMNDTVNAHDFINGVLDMGAEVSYSFDFQAEPGWNNTYTITLPASMNRPYTDGQVDANKIRWEVENGNGLQPSISADLSVQLKEPTTSQLENENITLDFELDTKKPEKNSLIANILTKTIDISNYDILPSFITNLEFIPADGIRLFIKNKLTSWEIFYQKTIKPIEEKTISIIENSSLNQTLETDFKWDSNTTVNCSIPYDIENMDDEPNIIAELTDGDIGLQICSISNRALYGLVNTGATANITAADINFGDNLDDIGHSYIGRIFLPDNIYLDGENIFYWDQNISIQGKFESEAAPEYSSEEINTLLEIDISSTDLNLLSFFTGKTELTLTLYMEGDVDYGVTTIPDMFSIPDKINLEYLNSDAFRLCIEENVFNEGDITEFLTDEKELFESRMVDIFPKLKIDGRINKEAFEKSLIWDKNIADMDADNPVSVVSYAHCSHPLSFTLSFIPPKFEIPNQNISLRGLQNNNLTYRIIFPKGTTIDVSDTLDRAVVGETKDGRYYLEVSFDATESGLTDFVSYKIIPSALFVVGVFMPCIISLIITVILVIVIYILRRKRKQKRVGVESDVESYDEGYEDQEYYVPPPPSSK